MTKVIPISFFFILFHLAANGQDLVMSNKKTKGELIFEYRYIEEYNRYWVAGVYLNTKRYGKLPEVYGSYLPILDHLLFTCGDRHGLIATNNEHRQFQYVEKIINSPYFRDTTISISGLKHYGGDIYEKTNDLTSLYVIFEVKVEGLLFYSACPCFSHPIMRQVHTDCDYDMVVKPPFWSIGKVKNIKRANKKVVSKLGFQRSQKKSFDIRYCE